MNLDLFIRSEDNLFCKRDPLYTVEPVDFPTKSRARLASHYELRKVYSTEGVPVVR